MAIFCCAAIIAIVRTAARRSSDGIGRIVRAVLGVAYVVLGSALALSPPVPVPPGVGFDPSWTLALARASSEHLIFGRDVVFSYGPLGYLVTTIAAGGNFSAMVAFQSAVAIVILAIVVERLYEPATVYQKVLLASFAPIVLANSAFEIWAPFLVLLVLTRPRGTARGDACAMLAAGAFGGIFALTKFTVAIDVVIIASVVFGLRAWNVRSNAIERGLLAASVSAFASGLLGGSASKFLLVDFGAAPTIVVDLLAAGTFAYAAFSTRPARGAAFAPVVLLAVASAISPAYRGYVTSSLEVAASYSNAFALEGPPWQVVSACCFLVAFATCTVLRGPAKTAGSALLAYEWTMFKLGFVRQDLHVLYFLSGSMFAALLLTYTASTRRRAIAAGIVFVASIATYRNELVYAHLPDPASALSLERLSHNVETIVNVRQVGARTDASGDANLRDDILPAALVQAVGRRSVDIVPAETASAFASGLHWVPEPVFESFMAATPALEARNLASLESRDDDAILYSFGSIDGRYPIGDEPAVFRYVLCHYANDAAHSASARGVLLLSHAARSRCGTGPAGAPIALTWNQAVTIPRVPGALTFAHVVVRPSLAGRIRAFAFRSAITHVTIAYDDGTSRTFRLVTANASEGVLVEPLPRDGMDLAALFAGTLSAHAVTLSLDADPRSFDAPSVSFESVPIHPG